MSKEYEEILFACYCRPLTKNEIKTHTGYTRIFDKKNNKFNDFFKNHYLKEYGIKKYHGRNLPTYITSSKIFIERIEEQMKILRIQSESDYSLTDEERKIFTLNAEEKKILDYLLDISDKDGINIFRSIVDLIGFKKVKKEKKIGRKKFVFVDEFRKGFLTIEVILQIICLISTYALIEKKFSPAIGGYSHNPQSFGEFKMRYKKVIHNSLVGKDIIGYKNKSDEKNISFLREKYYQDLNLHIENLNKKLFNILLPGSFKKEVNTIYEKYKKTPMANIIDVLSYSLPINLLDKLSYVSDISFYPKLFFIKNFVNAFELSCQSDKAIDGFSGPIKSVFQEMKILEKKIKENPLIKQN